MSNLSLDDQIAALAKSNEYYYKWMAENPTSKIIKKQAMKSINENNEQIRVLRVRKAARDN